MYYIWNWIYNENYKIYTEYTILVSSDCTCISLSLSENKDVLILRDNYFFLTVFQLYFFHIPPASSFNNSTAILTSPQIQKHSPDNIPPNIKQTPKETVKQPSTTQPTTVPKKADLAQKSEESTKVGAATKNILVNPKTTLSQTKEKSINPQSKEDPLKTWLYTVNVADEIHKKDL